MRVYVLTSDRYLPALRPFAWLFNRYWSSTQPVTVVGFTPPTFALPENFDFLSLGAMVDYPVTKWSNALLKLLDLIPDEPCVIMLEDYWLTRPVPTDAVQKLYDYCRQFRYVCRLDLTGDRLHAGGAALYGTCGDIDLIWSDPESQYHMSLMAALWNPHNLRRVLIPDETPWQVELEGTPRLRALRDVMIVIGTSLWPVKHTLAFRGGDSQTLLLDELDPDDVAELTKLGYLEPWGIG
jgi:hypothetical protein